MPQCTACGVTSDALSTCARCKAAKYCSKACQSTDWPVHKPSCKKVRPNYLLRFQVYPTQITNPPVWRTLSVPAITTFDKLHAALQIAFGWANTHTYEFVVNDPLYHPSMHRSGVEMRIIEGGNYDARVAETAVDASEPREYLLRVTDDWPKQPGYVFPRDHKSDRMHLQGRNHPHTPAVGASKTALYKVLDKEQYTAPGIRITYVYDLGDYWRHELRILGTADPTSSITCIDGHGHPIAEDCRCYPGWNEMLKASRAANPTAEQRSLIEEAKSASNGDPQGLKNGRDKIWDKDDVNRRLAGLV